jgi:indolepyruvate ferredoxin oxidoreductase alpha subunit
MIPTWARQRQKVVRDRTARLRQWGETAAINVEEMRDPAVGIITSGVAYQYVRESLPTVSTLKLGMTWPLPPERISAFAASVQTLYVVEELDPFLLEQVQALGIHVEPLPESLQLGELNPDRVAAALRGEDAVPAVSDLPPRPPVLCSGCPHRGVFMTLRKLKAYVTGDIGCYTLGSLPPLSALNTCLCMGAGIGEAHGIESACGAKGREVAVIGDSTFVHSGITGLINIAYNGGNSVVMILDNSTTAMTGGQDHPGTGVTLSGRPGRRLDIPALCRAVGIPNVEVVNPRDLKALEAALRAAMDRDEPSVIITRCPCVLISRERGKVVGIDEKACIQCGICLRIGCPAIASRPTDDPKQPQPVIDPSLCMGCHLCLQVCPKQAISTLEQDGAEI